MKNHKLSIFLTLLNIVIVISLGLCIPELYSKSAQIISSDTPAVKQKGAAYTGKYQNLFSKLLHKKDSEINIKISKAYDKLFYGCDSTERVYYPVTEDMAYMADIHSNDVRTEGMSYGMMITVQLDKKKEFDCLWKWAKTYMQHKEGASKDFFSWHCKYDGTRLDVNSASDGEEWFVMSLFFASARWGDGDGIFNYKAEAQKILRAMLNKCDSSDRTDVITNMFNKKEKQVVFVPVGNADDFTDPSYHLPHYYELWSKWADTNNSFWLKAANVSREFLKKAVNPKTGLAPDYASFSGAPYSFMGSNSNDFKFDAWRVAMNIALDYEWFAKDDWAVTECNNLLNFFYQQGIGKYGNNFTLDGKKLADNHSTGLVAMNAVAALASTNQNRKEFVGELWNLPIPDGEYRYYDGMLYMMSLLQCSGNFKIYGLQCNANGLVK